MTSKYDRSDIDPMDAFEERPVDAADAPHDGEPWPAIPGTVFTNCTIYPNDAIDPAEHATHTIIDALGTLDKELAKVCTLDRIVSLRRMIQGLEKQVTELANTAATKHEDFTR